MTVKTETCANCGGVIGNLETPYVWHGNVVCDGCHGRLTENVPAYRVPGTSPAPVAGRGDSSVVDTAAIVFLVIVAVCVVGFGLVFVSGITRGRTATSAPVIASAGPKEIALIQAIELGDVEMVKSAFADDPKVNVVDEKHRTPLTLAIDKYRNDNAILDMLFARGADANFPKGDFPPLWEAVSKYDGAPIVRYLLSKGANPNATCFGGRPLHEAYSPETAKVLIQSGADVNAVDEEGKTKLHLASADGNKVMVETLLSLNANVNIRDKQGRTPLKCARLAFRDDIAAMLQGRGGTE